MRTTPSIWAGLLLLATVVACAESSPPPPLLKVTSPARGLVQSDAKQLAVTGTVQPGTSGARVTQVTVNKVAATLAADGSFTATIDAPQGAMLLETTATADDGGSAVGARAVQSGALKPAGSNIPRAVTAALSADAFTRLSAVAGPLLQTLNLSAMLAPYQPMVTAGDSLANAKVSVTSLAIGTSKITLAPVAGGLAFTAALGALQVTANVVYAGALVPDGSTTVKITADQVTVGGTLVLTPAGTAGFTTQLMSPTVQTVALKLSATGLAGEILDLLNSTLGSSVQSMVTKSAELALGPLINQALGALEGPQQLDVLGHKLDLQAAPSAVTFTPAGALVTMDLTALLEGAGSGPGYIFMDNGSPTMDASHGVQLGLADDLVNELLAQVHTLGLLDISVQQDFGVFDAAQFQLSMPPMLSANTSDGAMRLVIGDMIATFSDKGKQLARAAINAQIDLKIAPGTSAQDIALQFGAVDLRINLLDDDGTGTSGIGDGDLSGPSSLGIGVQLDSLSKLMINLPVPAIEGIQLENLSVGADSGYVMVSGQIQ